MCVRRSTWNTDWWACILSHMCSCMGLQCSLPKACSFFRPFLWQSMTRALLYSSSDSSTCATAQFRHSRGRTRARSSLNCPEKQEMLQLCKCKHLKILESLRYNPAVAFTACFYCSMSPHIFLSYYSNAVIYPQVSCWGQPVRCGTTESRTKKCDIELI